MPVLKNPRWEAFAQGRATGLPAYKAYMQAGFKADKSVHVNASRLLRNAKVQCRLEEILTELASKMTVSVESLCMELDQAIALAHENNQASAAIAGIQAKAKLYGLDVDRSESKHTFNSNYASMTEEELAYEIAALNQEIRAIKAGKLVKH